MSLTLASPFLLAPMAGISTAGMRAICLEQGAGCASTGLVDAQGLARRSPGSLRRAHRGEGQGPQILQLFAPDVDTLVPALAMADELGFQGVELNLGCPAGPIVERGCGSALLGQWQILKPMLSALAGCGMPAGVKCRCGRRTGDRDFVLLYELAGEAGLDWFSLHPRSLEGAYREAVDWSLVELLPVGGPRLWAGGDLRSAAEARAALAGQPRLEAVVLGRAAISAPWIFGACLGRPDLDVAARARLLSRMLRALACDLDLEEGKRILPGLATLLGLPPMADIQLRLADRRRMGEWEAILRERLDQDALPALEENPFLR
jgi:tRNA-dihydrouridine synthase B